MQMDDFTPGSMQELDHRFGARPDVQFFVDVLEMGADRIDANTEMIGDFLRRIALGKLLKNFFLACREFFVFDAVVRRFAEGLHNLAGNLATHGRAPLLDLLNRAKDIRRISAF